MVTKTFSHDASTARSVEKQMRNWELSRTQHRAAQQVLQDPPFITIANIVGAGGHEVAGALGARLGWPVYDREILTRMAQDDNARAQWYHSMDERDLGWVETTVRSLVEQGFRKNDYFHRLVETAVALYRRGPAIYVGRSADLILPRDHGLRVKLIASTEFCIRHFAERNGVSLDQARHDVTTIEQDRKDFVRHHFRVAPEDSMRFDLLINIERMSVAHAVEIIAVAHQQRVAAKG